MQRGASAKDVVWGIGLAHNIIDLMRNTDADVALCWLGNLSWLIAGQGRLIAFDLDLDHNLRLQPPPVSTTEIAGVLDALFITHEHGDHFNAETATILAQHSNCIFVLPANCVEKARDASVPQSRMQIAMPGVPFKLLGIDVYPIRALHGDRKHAVYRYANLEDCGYVLTLGNQRLLQPGDSVLLQDHLELENIDILFVSPTEHNTHVEASVMLIQTLRPAHIFPQHFGTYQQTEQNAYWTKGYPAEVRAALPPSLQEHYHQLSQGEVYKIKN